MAPKYKDGEEKLALSGKWISWAHTVSAYAAFLGAFVVGVYLHYYKIVENEHFVRVFWLANRDRSSDTRPGLSR